jgi:serine protease Do
MMRTDCQLIGGDSGGPLFNLDGEVIGIHSRVSEEIDRNYHAPVEAFHRTWDLLVAGEWVPKRSGRGGGFLGVETRGDGEGVVIEDLVEDSAAERALLKNGDIITPVDDYRIAAPEELALAISSREPGEEVTIRYRREEEERTTKVELGERPDRRSER